ncbi:hypothetical protein ACTM97_07775 [Oliverpabstia intestinalis]|uniref:hypothetical protein n=1 Tax=Oliverpabstia intestinalis TaxID=2606633 RepID=UPI003F8BDE09
MIKVNTVALEENASNLQKIEMQVADILYDISLIEKELTCNHTVFEEEIHAIQKQTGRINKEKEYLHTMQQCLAQCSQQYIQTEQKNSRYGEEIPVTETTKKTGLPEVKVAGRIDLTMTNIYRQNQPNRMNIIRRAWINRWIVMFPWHGNHWKLMKAPVVKRSQVLVFLPDTVLNQRIQQMVQLMVK